MESRVDRKEELSENLSECQFDKLPKEIFHIELYKPLFGRDSTASDFISVPQTKKQFYSLFYNERQLGLDFLRRLLSNGALGELEEAENIWRYCRDLLTRRGTIYHPNQCYTPQGKSERVTPIRLDQNPGRPGYEDRTYLQILFMNEEWDEATKVIEDTKMSYAEVKKQFDEVFPDGKIVKYKWDLEYAKKLLKAVFDAIINDDEINYYRDDKGYYKLEKMGAETRAALNALYKYMKPNPKHKTGLVSDANFYIEALKYYDEDVTFDQFKMWQQQMFWNRQVEEWLAGGLGTIYLRPHAQGIGNPLTRKGCIMNDGTHYFAFRRSSNSLPGVDFFVGYYGRAVRGRWGGDPYRARGRFFKTYVKQTREQGQTLCSDMQRVQKFQRL